MLRTDTSVPQRPFPSARPDTVDPVTTEAIPIGRISAFVRWVARTPWPVFTLGMLQADIIGALLVLGFLRFGLPPEDRIQLQDLPTFNLAIFLGYLFLSFTVGSYLTLRHADPGDALATPRHAAGRDRDPAATEMARTRALKMPFYRSVINVTNWLPGLRGVHRRQLAGRQQIRAGRRGRHRARRHRDGDHRLSAVRTGAPARGRGRACAAACRRTSARRA